MESPHHPLRPTPGIDWKALELVRHRKDWLELRNGFVALADEAFADWITPDQSQFEEQRTYALGRFDEDAELSLFLSRIEPPTSERNRLRLLDVGAGNGGVSSAIANTLRWDVTTIDLVPNPNLRRVRRRLGIPLHQTVGTGHRLPFAGESFDAVLLLDMLEHVTAPRELACEVMRVMKRGVCMITTFARLKFPSRATRTTEYADSSFFPTASSAGP